MSNRIPYSYSPFDPVVQFADWFLRQPILSLRPPATPLLDYGTTQGFIIYRAKPFQVELFTLPPNHPFGGRFAEHSHPNVDSVEIWLHGKLDFFKSGISLEAPEVINSIAPDGAWGGCGTWYRVRDYESHGAAWGQEGGAFLSIQYWKNGVEPTSVGMDWSGPSTHPKQTELLKKE